MKSTRRAERALAKPGEPVCPAEGCDRRAGFGTDHDGEGYCFRHRSHAARLDPTPTPAPEPPEDESAPVAGPLARRLTGSRSNPAADPLAVLRRVLASARAAGYPFGGSLGARRRSRAVLHDPPPSRGLVGHPHRDRARVGGRLRPRRLEVGRAARLLTVAAWPSRVADVRVEDHVVEQALLTVEEAPPERQKQQRHEYRLHDQLSK